VKDMTDQELLERFVTGDSSAFEELVRRHAGWIYHVAQRQLHDAALADDAAQAVFLVLIRKARSLRVSIPLAAWLHRVTILTTKEILRKEARRKQREETAAMMRPEQISAEDNAWTEIAPLLEAQMQRLRKKDRQAILLRFYAQREFADVAAELQTTESAARKRVERAVQKLHQLFAAQDIHHSSELLGSALLIRAGGAATGDLVSRIANQTASSAGTAISRAVLRKLRWMKTGLIGSVAGIASVALIAAGVARSAAAPNNAVAKSDDPAVVQSSASPNQPATQSVDPELDRLIAQLQTAETKIHNLHIIHFAVTRQRRFPTIPGWTPTPGRFEGSAWFDDGDSSGRARYQFTKYIEEMTDQKNGKKAWWSESIDCGTDGRQTRYTMSSDNVIISPRPEMHIRLNPSMQIYPGVDFMLIGLEGSDQPWSFPSAQIAVMCTKNPTYQKYNARLSEELLRRLGKGEKFHVQEKKINGVQTVGIVAEKLKPGDPSEEWWFDPQRNYTLVQSKEFVYGGRADPQTGWSVDVTKWKLAAPGIWFPMAAICEEDRTEHFDRYTYAVDDVIANNPKFDQTNFLPPIKVGERVLDYHSKPPKEYNFSEDSGIPGQEGTDQ
jgi:RNA polymerase sigma factor (sigma-70 family)